MGRLGEEVHMGSKTTVGVHAGAKEETDLALFVGREAKVEAADALPSDMMIDDLMFSDGVFPSLPDFPCLSSPSESPSMSTSAASRQPKAACFSNKSSASSSSSSSYSSPWSPLKVSPESHAMQVVPANVDRMSVSTEAVGLLSPESDGLDILGAVDIWESSEPGGRYDPSSFFLGEGVGGGCGVDVDEPDRQTPTVDEAEFLGAGRECSSEDLAKVFFDWLKNNKDSILPEDLRSIKLKRSTIECAASRLGGDKQGQVQLLKLILAWVQNHHLQRKRRRSRGVTSSDRYANQDITANTVATSTGPSQISYHTICPAVVTTNLNTNHYDSTSSNTWMPYASEQLSFSTSTSAYRDKASVPPPYHYYHNQPYSQLPPSDFHSAEQTAATWHQRFSPASSAVHYSPFSPTPASTSLQTEAAYHAGFAPHFTGAQPVYSPASGVARLPSATKEARKNRMARHKRSSLHNNRSQQQLQQRQQQVSDAVTAMDEGSSSPALSNAQNARSWSFWSSSLPASSHQITSQTDNPALLPSQLLLPPAPQPPPAGENPLRHLSISEKRRGLKSERNMRFLLQKVLKQSDVGSLGRIVLPKIAHLARLRMEKVSHSSTQMGVRAVSNPSFQETKMASENTSIDFPTKEAEIHLPELDARDGISIEMEDIGTSRIWNMRYRFWPNNKSRMYLLENTGDFVRANGLQEGDFIVIYADVKCGKYMIRGVKVRQAMEAKGASSRNSVKVHHQDSS